MKKFLKLEKAVKFIMVILMITGIVFTTLNILSVNSTAFKDFDGTQQSNDCCDEPLNCYKGGLVK